MKKTFFLFSLFLSTALLAQVPSTSAVTVTKALEEKAAFTNKSLVKNLPFKNIGPTVMSGRVVDLVVNPENPTEFYVGYASGGVWHTVNNGTSFEPILDTSPTQNVGTLAVDWKSGTIWVGTGEVNASRSSYAGIGLLKSSDKGKTWQSMGLEDSHHISKILINPANADEIVVGVIGHLYSENQERGVFKSFDGGKTWNKTLFINAETGIIEMEVDPNNFNIMYASAWDKDRKAWNFEGNGSGSGIYKSTDAGNSWTKVSTEASGFPVGEGVGRIGLAIVNENVVYAIHDSQFRREDTGSNNKTEGLSKEDFKTMTRDAFLNLDNKTLEGFLRNNGFQEKYSAETVKQLIEEGEAKPMDLALYLEDANTQLFDTPVIGAEVYKSTNGGKTWKKTHEGYLDGIYYSYGYYFGKIHVAPNNPDAIYTYGVPILKSKDGGKTFTSMDADNVHADHHALWINPKMPGHLINGNDGGVNISYDDGAHWIKCNTPAVGQFYAINVDNAKPYNVYGGLQDNGVWVGPHTTEENTEWLQEGQYPYKRIMGGDGMQIQIDNRNNQIVYTGFQFGNYFRIDRASGKNSYIQPKHELGESPYRFNWQTPILLSEHNQDILYLGGNKLMRSLNQGDDWEAISPDLTQGGKPGNVAYGTLTTMSESTFQFGLIYTGSDDGLIYVTQNSGADWTNISQDLPKDLWVSRVIASQHKKSRVYATLNGYRWDNFAPYIYRSDDFGATWESISGNIPASPVNVIKEDPLNENILYVGTDNGAYVSFNQGNSWEPFSHKLPNVAVHDIVVQPEAKHLVLGTHGRSIYIADISLLQQLSASNSDQLVLNEITAVNHSRRWGQSFSPWNEAYEPSVEIQFYAPQSGEATLSVNSEDGEELMQWSVTVEKGINVESYHLTVSERGVKNLKKSDKKVSPSANGKNYLPKGDYRLKVSLGGKTASGKITLK
ncbi:MAG: glycosyl hydrolase [Flavobacteriaceae bacterium]|nr:glycosyl hydrolase [Flavobacteriaceae bacterium]|tara:strand:+ start:30861 stop:33701 length:2841 start_codon:yes stop_codon:yes gene_type:complete